MHIQDLGHIGGPVWLIGGPYSNLAATRAFLARARATGIAGGQIVCTGDMVGYCAEPIEVLEEMEAAGLAMIAGNVERQLAAGAGDCGCGFDDGTTCAALSQGWYAHADARVAQAWRRWMRDLPDWLVFTCAAGRFAVVHGAASDVARFLWPSSDAVEFAAEIALVEARLGPVDGVIAGHSGLAFERRIGRQRWINAGVLGLPPHDGRPWTRYAVLEAGGTRIHRLKYDHAGAARAMQAAGMEPDYARTLGTGLWPSEDVMPRELRCSTSGLYS